MNIPLINSNSKQDINTSLIAIRNAINELARMKESGSVEDLQRQINIINQQITTFNSEFATINTHLNTIDTNILNLQPVDTVASGNLHSVTSNAVATQTVRYIGNAHGKTLAEIFNTYSKQNGMVYRGWLDWNDSRCPLYGQGANTVEIACYDWNLIAYSLDGRVWYYSTTDGWQQANYSGTANLISTYVTSGSVTWQKSGRLVLVTLGNVTLSVWSDGDKTIGTGLPKAQIPFSCAIPPLNSTDSAQLFEVTRAGELRTNGGMSHYGAFYGSFCYISEN